MQSASGMLHPSEEDKSTHRYVWWTLIVLVYLEGILCSLAGAQPRRPVPVEGTHFVLLRVLTRSGATIYQEPDVTTGIVAANLPGLHAYYVYTRSAGPALGAPRAGWYEVGSDVRGTVLGWMQAAEVLEWQQPLALASTPPNGRSPVLLFDQQAVLRHLVQTPDATRQTEAQKLYATLRADQAPPATFPVRAVEPQQALAITRQLALLPMLEVEAITRETWAGSLCKVAALVAHPEARQTLERRPDDGSRQQGLGDPIAMPREPRKAVAIDVVFVLDMASSMQPYLDATLTAITDLAILMYEANGARRESVHIGLWGYRDVQDGSTLEFPLKNFTPPLQVADGFIKTLRTERVPHRTAGADPILSDGT